MKIRLLLAFLGCVLALARVSAADKPNILWLVSEDNSSDWLGCYGNAQAETPILDALAEEGILFESAYSNSPVCAVARATLLMGAYSPTMGTQHMRSRHAIPDEYETYVHYMAGLGYHCSNHSKTDYNIKMNDAAPWEKAGAGGTWKDTPDDRPFLAVFNYHVSHESSLFDDKPKEPARLKPEEIDLPPYLPDLPAVRKDFARYHDRMTALDRQIGEKLDELEAAGLAEDTIVFYYADHGGPTPRGKRYLEDTGVRVPLIVRVPEKWRHLSPFEPGTRIEEPVSFVDFPATIISLGGGETPEQMQGRAFLGEHRAEPGEDEMEFLFADRFDELYGMRRGITDGKWKYIRYFTPNQPDAPYSFYQFGLPSWRAMKKAWEEGELEGYHKAMWDAPQAVERLFDLAADPWEVNNLAGDPAHLDRLEAMRERLKSTMVEVRDTGLAPEPMFEKLAGDGTIAGYVRSDSFDPERTVGLAFLAAEGDPAKLDRLTAAMKSDDPVIRYWGVQGMLVLGEGARPAADEIETLLDDEHSVNRVTAARSLIMIGREERGKKALASELEREVSGESLLYAVNALSGTNADELISDDWIESMLDSEGNNYLKRFARQLKADRE